MDLRHERDTPESESMLTPFRQGTLLVLTRNEQLAGVVSHALEGLGTNAPRLSMVENLSDCLIAMRLLGPSLVVLDDEVNTEAGLLMLDELLQARPGTPVIYVASHHTLELERDVRRRGVLFYVEMPETREMLDSSLARLLGSLVRDSGARKLS